MIDREALDLVFKIATWIAQIAMPVAIFLGGRYIARAQYMRSVQDSWNEFNKVAIANPDNLQEVKKLMPFSNAGLSNEDVRRHYLMFIELNAFQAMYLGAKHGLLDKHYQMTCFQDLLIPQIADDEFYGLSQNRGYHPDFKRVCRELRARARVEQQTKAAA